ncbi:MAG: hypothetical protein HY349_07815 [Nitrospirae bacterium]|nr:hypothetical protein [Nitrospirota bacterium]
MTHACSRRRGKKPVIGLIRPTLAVLLFLLSSLVSSENLEAKGPQKELPMLVTVNDLAEQPGEYDGHRVVVTGRIQSMEIQRGRRGSEYLILVLEDDSAESSVNVKPVKIFSPTLPKLQEGDPALVQGVYHKEGRQGGRPWEHFVDAEVILRN